MREEDIKKLVEKTIKEKLSKKEADTHRKGEELEKEIKIWKRKQEDKWEKDENNITSYKSSTSGRISSAFFRSFT